MLKDFFENHTVYEVMWKKNMEQRLKAQTINNRKRITKTILWHKLRICNNYYFSVPKSDCTKTSQCYVTRALPVLSPKSPAPFPMSVLSPLQFVADWPRLSHQLSVYVHLVPEIKMSQAIILRHNLRS
jgi:hypothetical protein